MTVGPLKLDCGQRDLAFKYISWGPPVLSPPVINLEVMCWDLLRVFLDSIFVYIVSIYQMNAESN